MFRFCAPFRSGAFPPRRSPKNGEHERLPSAPGAEVVTQENPPNTHREHRKTQQMGRKENQGEETLQAKARELASLNRGEAAFFIGTRDAGRIADDDPHPQKGSRVLEALSEFGGSAPATHSSVLTTGFSAFYSHRQHLLSVHSHRSLHSDTTGEIVLIGHSPVLAPSVDRCINRTSVERLRQNPGSAPIQ